MGIRAKWLMALAVSVVLHIAIFALLSTFVTGRKARDLPCLGVIALELSKGKEEQPPLKAPQGEAVREESPMPPLGDMPELLPATAEISAPEVRSAAPVPVLEGSGAPEVELRELPLPEIRALPEQGGEVAAVRSSLRPIGEIRPVYPRSARERGVEGVVRVELVIGADGRVKHSAVAVSSGHADLDKAALRAIRRAVFSPAKEGGRPVEAPYTLEIVFKLK